VNLPLLKNVLLYYSSRDYFGDDVKSFLSNYIKLVSKIVKIESQQLIEEYGSETSP